VVGGIVGTTGGFASERDCLRELTNESLAEAVLSASKRDEVRLAILRLYDDVAREIDSRRPLCAMSGRCCRFDEFGHRLYVTTLELAAFFQQLRGIANRHEAADPAGCPFQSGKLCTVHAIRPFGCRIFFCDATSTGWQNQVYERFHARLQRLHEELNVPYFYVEWREALRILARTA
jgi:Fe-S-cluster containining protein